MVKVAKARKKFLRSLDFNVAKCKKKSRGLCCAVAVAASVPVQMAIH